MQQKCLFFGEEQFGFARVAGAVASEGASPGAGLGIAYVRYAPSPASHAR
jgi:hypothetical protein